jgi:hypothetical protein
VTGPYIKPLRRQSVERKFGPKCEEISGASIKLREEEIHNPHSYTNIIRTVISSRMRRTVIVDCMGEKRNANRLFSGQPVGKSPLGRQA